MIPHEDAVADGHCARVLDTHTYCRAAANFAGLKIVDTWDRCPIPTDGAVSVSVPELLIPPPGLALPLRIVSFERVTWGPLEIVTTLPTPPPSMIVLGAPEPRMVKLLPMVRFS